MLWIDFNCTIKENIFSMYWSISFLKQKKNSIFIAFLYAQLVHTYFDPQYFVKGYVQQQEFLEGYFLSRQGDSCRSREFRQLQSTQLHAIMVYTICVCLMYPRASHLLTKQVDVFPQDFVKYRSREIRFKIWQTTRQRGCRDACQISERYDHHNIQSRGFDTSRVLAVRRP